MTVTIAQMTVKVEPEETNKKTAFLRFFY